jgi:hypothetical protein
LLHLTRPEVGRHASEFGRVANFAETAAWVIRK